MANPELKGRSISGKILAIKFGADLARDFPKPIAIVRVRQQVMGDRRIRAIWYPLVKPHEQELAVGQKVIITKKTEKFGKGSITTSTIRPA